MESLIDSAVAQRRVRELSEEDARVISAAEDVRGLLALKVALQAESHFRLLWVRLVILVSIAAAGSLVQVEVGNPGPVMVSFVIVAVMAVIIVAAMTVISAERIRTNADLADEWIVLIDYRLTQLAVGG